MTVNGLEVLIYTLLFLVPGFIINGIVWRLVEEDEQPQHILFLRFLTFSSINFGLWSPLILSFIHSDYWLSKPWLSAVLWISMMVCSPLVIGFLLGVAEQKHWLSMFLGVWGIRVCTIDKPTAWESYLWNLQDPTYILLTLDDGSEIAGYLGSKSLVTSKDRGGDIYIEELYRIQSGEWIQVPGSRGIWIKGSAIKYVEFKV